MENSIVYRGPSSLTGEPIVAILTDEGSTTKTGCMLQLWVIADTGQIPHETAKVCAENALYAAYLRGSYAGKQVDLTGQALRLGAYGDPAELPIEVIERLTAQAGAWIGYTHQWRRFPTLRPYCMAIVETCSDARIARASGWRVFIVTVLARGGLAAQGLVLLNCPASAESGKKTVCAQCLLCDGTSSRLGGGIFVAPD